jgi:hypothetical protein
VNALQALDAAQASPSMDAILRFQSALAALPQAECPVEHVFSDHTYTRHMMLKAGQAATGMMHATRHVIIIAGDCTITTDVGVERLTGFHVRDSKAGTKRAVFAHEDTHFVTVHVTDETDIDKIQAAVILPDPLPAIEGETK